MPNHVHFFKSSCPARPDIIRVKMGRTPDIGNSGLAVCHFAGDSQRLAPSIGFSDAQRFAFAGERELAGERPLAILIDDAADRGGINAAAHPVEHDLRDGGLSGLGLAARLKIDRVRGDPRTASSGARFGMTYAPVARSHLRGT